MEKVSEAGADDNSDPVEQQYSVRKGYDYGEKYQSEREQRFLSRLCSHIQRICTQNKIACKDNTFVYKSSFIMTMLLLYRCMCMYIAYMYVKLIQRLSFHHSN